MRIGRKWGLGLLGIAMAGTVALVLPSHAPSEHGIPYAMAAIQPDRAVQQEAIAIANRVDTALRRSTSLLSTVAEGDLSAFSRERIALNAASSQWPITLFTAAPGKGSEFALQPPGERFLTAEDVSEIQRRGPWVAERPQVSSLIAAVPGRTGQVLAAKIPFSYFSDALASLPKPDGVRHYLLDTRGKPLENAAAPSGEDRDWCEQLIREGEGFLATSDALFAVARVPSTGWAVVVRHPLSGVNPPLSLEPAFMSGPAMVATAPLGGPGIPKGLVLYPLAGVVLLFGLALVGWKQRWPGMEEGPIAFGEHALRRVTGPLRERIKGRTAPRPALPEGLVPFAADVPSQLPAAIAGDDVEFLRSEQVRNLRELWSHTEERLSGQRSWVREEVRKLQETATSSFSELSAIVNQTEQRLDDTRIAWGDVQASLLTRIDEARTGIIGEQDARRGMVDRIEQQERRLGDSLEAFETRMGEGLSANDARIGQLEAQLAQDLASTDAQMQEDFARLEAAISSARAALNSLEARESADSDSTRVALDAQTERLSTMEGALAQAEDRLDSDLQAQAHAVRGVEQLIQTTAERFADEIAAVAVHAERLEEALHGFEGRVATYRADLDERIVALQAGLQDGIADGEARTREALAEQQITLERLRGDLDLAVEQALPRIRTEIEEVRGEVAQRVDGFILDLESRLEERVVSGLDQIETTLQELRTELQAAQEGHQTDLETLMTELAAIADEAIPSLRRDVAPVHALDGRARAAEARLEAFGTRMDAFADQAQAMQAEAAALAARQETLESALSPLPQRIDDVEGKLSPLASRIESLEGGLKQLDERWDGAKGRLDSLLKEAEGRFLGKVEDLATRTGALESLANQRFEQAQAAIGGLESKLEKNRQAQEDTHRLNGELGGIKGRLEGLALAHGRQQETLNAALAQLAKLQQDVGTERQDPALAGRVDDLTGLVQQLAEQSRLLAQALDANTAAAARTESWIHEELGSLQSTQNQALAALEQENAALKSSLETMRESQEALSHRMHMIVQVLSKLSK